MIIDLDAHQGNGHETDFANDSMVASPSLGGLINLLLEFKNCCFILCTNRSSLYPGYVQP